MRTVFALVACLSLSACAGAPPLPPELVPHVETADAVVAAARAGDSRRAIALLLQLGMQRKEIEAVADAFASCLAPLVPPQGSES